MRNILAKVVRLSALVATAGALSFAVFFSNCGGEGGMRTGSAGNGAAGSGGTTGTGGGGTAGASGSGGRFVCPTDQTLDCAAAITLASGHVTNFAPEEWSPMDGKYCNASGLRGSVFSYSGPEVDGGNISSNAHGVDAPAGNFRLTLMAGPGGYAGGGISFDHCVTASSFNAIRFTTWLASGDQMNCTFKIQLQTFEQRPTSQSPPGACDSAVTSCYGFPASPSITLTTAPTTVTVPFSMLTGATHTNPFQGQIVGLQWQLESGPPIDDGGAQTACSVEVRIDDIDFVTQ